MLKNQIYFNNSPVLVLPVNQVNKSPNGIWNYLSSQYQMNLFLYVNLVELYYSYLKQRSKEATSFSCFTLEVTLNFLLLCVFLSDHRKSIYRIYAYTLYAKLSYSKVQFSLKYLNGCILEIPKYNLKFLSYFLSLSTINWAHTYWSLAKMQETLPNE